MTRKYFYILAGGLFAAACAAPIVYGGIDFGVDSSQYAFDGECDDPRFAGGGMATNQDVDNIKRDASDCLKLYQAQRIRLARTRAQWDISQCRRVSYGNNSSQWSRDGECDDPRFTGPGVDEILLGEDRMADAADCRALCNSGAVWLK
ncbi:MAG: hypothetical protein HUJ27_00135 [Rhodobacteraceae bacterium]|nr:hypothetical protein [Paracoccaceae bacterium]